MNAIFKYNNNNNLKRICLQFDFFLDLLYCTVEYDLNEKQVQDVADFPENVVLNQFSTVYQ